MTKQRNQIIALVLLVIFWVILWIFYIRVHPTTQLAPKAEPAKVSLADSLLRLRFRRVRAETDALYRYRTKPAPFDARDNPFRLPGVTDVPVITLGIKTPSSDASLRPPDFAESLLKTGLTTVRVGGVVNLHGVVKLTIGGQLHKEGDVFTANIPTSKGSFKAIRIRILHLSEELATFGLEDSETGSAEYTIHLKEERR
jgi:hypothetical protein